jgi:hypothetical protein
MFITSSGEVAWPLDRAGDAAAWIASQGLAIVGGEAWLVDQAGRIMAVIPVTGSTIPAVRGWSVRGRQPDEQWAGFVARCLNDALTALRREGETINDEVPADLRDQLRYNMTCVSEQGYKEL